MAKNVIYYQNGEKVIRAGDEESRMYIILEGEVEISLTDGANRIQVAVLKKGDFFGEISLFENTLRSADAMAIGNVKLVFIESINELKTFLVKNPNFAAKMVHILANRLVKTNELLISKVSELNKANLMREMETLY